MQTKGLLGTLFVIPSLIDTAGRMTTAQVQEMAAAGWSLGNHTYDHASLDQLDTFRMTAEFEDAAAWFASRNLSFVPHVAYPGGRYDDRVRTVLQQLGYLTGRNNQKVRQSQPIDQALSLNCRQIANTDTLAAIEAVVDADYAAGACCVLLFHKLVASPSSSLEWAIADFHSLIDYIVAKGVAVKTMSDWYAFASGVAVGPCLNLGSLSLWDSDGYRLLPDIDMGAPQLAFGTATNYAGGPQAQIDLDRSALVPVHWQEEVTGATSAQLQSRVDALVAEVNKSLNTLVWSPAADVAAQTYTIVASQAPHIVYDNTVLLAYRAIVDIDLWRQP
jgi:hypothetical protein